MAAFARALLIAAAAAAAVLAASASPVPQEFSRWAASCDGLEHTAGVALGDIDADGDLDIVLANGRHFAEADWVYSNNGAGVFAGRRRLENEPDRSYGVALGDLDRDGDLDAVVANDSGSSSVAYANDGRGTFTVIAALGTWLPARRAVALGDFDSDGDLDAVLAGVDQDHVYLNDGAGRRWVEQPFESRPSKGSRATSVAAADIDGDNDLDILVPGRYEEPNVIFINDGKGRFPETRQFGNAVDDVIATAVGDIDGDGDVDIVTGQWEQPHAVFLNDGKGYFGNALRFGDGKERTWSVVLGDVDLDGDLDVLVGNTDIGFWWEDLNSDKMPDRFGFRTRGVPSRAYLNDGRGRFMPGVTFGTGSDNTRPIAAGDLDRDDDLDVVMGNDCQPFRVFYNSLRTPSPRR